MGWDGRNQPVIVAPEELPQGYRVEIFSYGLERIASMAFAPDGRLFLTEQHTGSVRIVGTDGSLEPEPFATVGPLPKERDTLGLLGIVVHPAFPNPAYVYIYYTEAPDDDEGVGRLVLQRFTERDGVGADATVLAEFPIGGGVHVGGSLEFGPDGKLYLPIGNTERRDLVQDLSSPIGKVLRLNDDGSAPDDNPFADVPDADRRVFAYGFRNTYDIAYHPELNAWVGGDNAAEEYDEINVIRAGGNYGHPLATGYIDSDESAGMVNPVWAYLFKTGPAGIEVYTADRLASFRGDVFFCQFHRGGLLHRMKIAEEGVQSDVVIAPGCTTDVVQGVDGFLYFADGIRGRIWRIVDTPAP